VIGARTVDLSQPPLKIEMDGAAPNSCGSNSYQVRSIAPLHRCVITGLTIVPQHRQNELARTDGVGSLLPLAVERDGPCQGVGWSIHERLGVDVGVAVGVANIDNARAGGIEGVVDRVLEQAASRLAGRARRPFTKAVDARRIEGAANRSRSSGPLPRIGLLTNKSRMGSNGRSISGRNATAPRWMAVAGVLIVGLAHAHPGRAETNPAMSEALFQEAKRLTAAGKYAEACPKLEESYRLDPGTGTLLNLGVCYEKTGRTAKAWACFNEAASAARREGRSDRFKMATEHAKALEPTLSRLVVVVGPGADLSGLEVRVDDTILGRASWGFAMPYDPGTHHVTATTPGKRPYKTSVALGAKGDRREIVIGVLEADPSNRMKVSEAPSSSPAKAGVAVPLAPDAAAPAPGPSRVPMVLIGGLGVVGIGVGAYFGVQAISKRDASNRTCAATFCDDPAAVEKMSAAQRDAWISNVGMGVGIVGVGVATYLFFAGRASNETKNALTVVPVLGLREGGLALSRSW